MLLTLIRHGQSVNNAVVHPSEHLPDPPLTELGQQQSKRLAAYLHQQRTYHRLYVSPMLRAMQTAKPLADALDLQPEIWVDLHEAEGVGDRGLNRAAIQAQFPSYTIPDEITDDGWWFISEDRVGCRARALRVAERLREMDATERVILVSHGTFINDLLQALFGVSMPDDLYILHENTGRTELTLLSERGHILHYINRVEHL